MSSVFKSGYLKEGWKWEYVPQSQRDIYWLRWKVFFTWDLQMSFAIYDAWCRKAAIQYMSNIYLIAKKIIAPIYLTDEVFEHYKRMRATDEAFKKKFELMSTNRKSKVGGPGTGISLRSARSTSARQHGDMLAELTSRLEEMSTQTPDTSIDEDVVYLEEQMERQEQMQRYKVERQEENREMQDWLARMKESLMQHLGIRPNVPPTPRTPPLPVTERSGPQSDDHPGHLNVEITPSQTAHSDDHQPGHWTDPHKRMPEEASPVPEAMIRTQEVLCAHGVLDEDAKRTSPIGFQVLEIPLDSCNEWAIFKPRDPPRFQFEHKGVEFKDKNEDCTMKACVAAGDGDRYKATCLKISVDGRRRTSPPMPDDFVGNVVLWAYPRAGIKV
ncbi:hypothetical protein Syun_029393 [Stephania yunnanensis]|uniref:Uncharacterized protein n=1 Tax=Stephania yunnanensis TaxID=152371 RepID=A0AAP0HH94_9MAGN